MEDYSIKITDPNGEKVKKWFIDVWLSDPAQKTFNKIVFDPALKTETNYNELQYESKPAYIQMLYKNPSEIFDNKFTAQRLYDKSKQFASINYLNHSYSIQKFGQGMSKILNKYKKRTGTGYVYDINININEFSKVLYEYDPAYYRFINNLDDEMIPTFIGTE